MIKKKFNRAENNMYQDILRKSFFIIYIFLTGFGPLQAQYLSFENWKPGGQHKRPKELPSPKKIFQDFHGLHEEKDVLISMEGNGYFIDMVRIGMKPSKENYSDIIAKYFVDATPVKYMLTGLPSEAKVYTVDIIKYGIPGKEFIYLLPDPVEGVLSLSIQTYNKNIDTLLLDQVALSFFYDGLYSPVFTKHEVRSFLFNEKKIVTDSVCTWMSPHNLTSWGYGQMNWQYYHTREDALVYQSLQLSRAKEGMRPQTEEVVEVVFNGIKTKAIKTTSKILVSKETLKGKSDVLIAYYVVVMVKKKYVQCVMSFYEDEAPVGGLPSLILHVMHF